MLVISMPLKKRRFRVQKAALRRIRRNGGLEGLEGLEGMEPVTLSRSTLEEVGGFQSQLEEFQIPQRKEKVSDLEASEAWEAARSDAKFGQEVISYKLQVIVYRLQVVNLEPDTLSRSTLEEVGGFGKLGRLGRLRRDEDLELHRIDCRLQVMGCKIISHRL